MVSSFASHAPDENNGANSSSEFSVLLFAALKDAAQTSSIQIRSESSRVSVAQLLKLGGQQFPTILPYLPYVRVAVNFEYSNAEQTVSAADEIAFLPPVSGGSVETVQPIVEITHQRIETDEIARSVEKCLDGGAGAVLTFEGIVRDNANGHLVNFLEYFAYEEMARRVLQTISNEVKGRWNVPCAIVHRLGKLEIGEASVVICVASPHRAQSFDACRYAIDRVKEIVPIWKKETARDGFWWVEDPLHVA